MASATLVEALDGGGDGPVEGIEVGRKVIVLVRLGALLILVRVGALVLGRIDLTKQVNTIWVCPQCTRTACMKQRAAPSGHALRYPASQRALSMRGSTSGTVPPTAK